MSIFEVYCKSVCLLLQSASDVCIESKSCTAVMEISSLLRVGSSLPPCNPIVFPSLARSSITVSVNHLVNSDFPPPCLHPPPREGISLGQRSSRAVPNPAPPPSPEKKTFSARHLYGSLAFHIKHKKSPTIADRAIKDYDFMRKSSRWLPRRSQERRHRLQPEDDAGT
uniref:HMG box domain-containing protein n=1 Tax=Steinernema glaseri TaxID=37863 RepID=A0A1I7ZRA1_9BILA